MNPRFEAMRSVLAPVALRAFRPAQAFCSATRGSAAVEFAVTVPVFIAMSLGLLYLGVSFLAKQHLETVAENAAYNVMINNTATTGSTQAAFQSYICANLSGIFSCPGVMVDLQPQANVSNPFPTITYDASGNVTNSWKYTTPSSGTVMELRVMYQWPTIKLPFGISFGNQPNGNMLIMSVQVFKVEPT
jgi:Flp pilus assembly protein TadG